MKLPDNLPPLKKAPNGKQWVYRGTGWMAKDAYYAFLPRRHADGWDYAATEYGSNASGVYDYHYVELVDVSPSTLEGKIALAKEMVGKSYRIYNLTATVKSWHVINVIDHTTNSHLVANEVENNDVCVYVKDDHNREIPVGNPDYVLVVDPLYYSFELNSTYTAKVYKEKIEVGCQEFPISILEDLLKLHKNFK